MIGGFVKKAVAPVMAPVAGKVLQSGMSANKITLIGFALGLIGCFFVAMGQFPLALVFILLNRFFDSLAAAAAHQIGITAQGSYMDVVFDYVIYGGFVFAFSLAMTEHLMASSFLLFSYMAMLGAWLAHRTFGTLDGVHETERFQGGLIGSAEITIFMICCCLYPPGFSYFALLMGLLCWVTTILRIRKALSEL